VTIDIELPLVVNGKPLTHNQRHHYLARNRLVQEIRHAAGWNTKAAMLRDNIPAQRHIIVQLHYQPGGAKRHRDAPNLTATSKPAIDGVVDAGLVKDDHDGYVTEVMPVIHPEPGKRRLWLAIRLPEETV